MRHRAAVPRTIRVRSGRAACNVGKGWLVLSVDKEWSVATLPSGQGYSGPARSVAGTEADDADRAAFRRSSGHSPVTKRVSASSINYNERTSGSIAIRIACRYLKKLGFANTYSAQSSRMMR